MHSYCDYTVFYESVKESKLLHINRLHKPPLGTFSGPRGYDLSLFWFDCEKQGNHNNYEYHINLVKQ